MTHRLDTDSQIFFYENDFYPFSSFSAFQVNIWGHLFPTAEHAYHWRKFMRYDVSSAQSYVLHAPSAHEAFKKSRLFADMVDPGWNERRVDEMRQIIRAKCDQHEYVRQKLHESGSRELIEDSWRDSFWGWGENKDGANTLGLLWMELRAKLWPTTADVAASPVTEARENWNHDNWRCGPVLLSQALPGEIEEDVV